MSTPAAWRDYLAEKLVGGVIVQAVLLFVVATLAISRTAGDTLSAGVLAGLAAGAAFSGAAVGWLAGLYEGAYDALDGAVAPPAGPPQDEDPLAAEIVWRRTLPWVAGGVAWVAAGAFLVGAVLGGDEAPLAVVVAVLAGLAGTVAVGVDLAGRAAGARAATRPTPVSTPLHRRAWRHLAAPVAGVTAAVNVGLAWILFRDYTTGDAFAGRALTRGEALADAGVIVVIVTVFFGYLARRWGRVDAALGRVDVGDAATGVSPRAQLGRQGLVYVALTGFVLAGFAAWFLPPLPSLTRVMLIRGLFAGAVTFAVVGVAHVRGAVNEAASGTASSTGDAAAPERGRAAAPPTAGPRPRRTRRMPVGAAAALALLVAVGAPLARSTPAVALDPFLDERRIAAEAEAFGLRVEYDIPLPAGTGTVPRVVGRVGVPENRNAQGLVAAPTHFDAVVGGTYHNPDKENPGEENNLPQTECFHPGNDLETAFRFPTDTKAETEGLPPVSYATAHCGAGPEVALSARVAEVGGEPTPTSPLAPIAVAGTGTADALIRPVQGVLHSEAATRVEDVVLAGGALRIGTVVASGSSQVTGKPGDQATVARVSLTDVEAGGVTFSVANDRMLVAGQEVPIDSALSATVMDAVNQALAPTGCTAALVGPTDRYPQGFLLARQDPRIGVNDDGTLAGSMAGGLLLVCDVPEEVSGNTDFNPQRAQVLVGFVFTNAEAREGVGGFGISDLGGTPGDPGTLGTAAVATSPAVAEAPASVAGVTASSSAEETTVGAPPPTEAPAALPAVSLPGAGVFGNRLLWLVAAAAWLGLTDRAVRSLRSLLADGEGAAA